MTTFPDPQRPDWRKSSRCSDSLECVEMARFATNVLGIRDSTRPSGDQALLLATTLGVGLLQEIKAGLHDLHEHA
ncbi:DUF397 domain-containing protein [Actinomadura sp. 9N215]|uniref:DUF397 domain-containing protein n=1 Tax=Actinomadura sp. 9N215 TaxID=3375150 RepID=UPI0037B2E4F8